MDSPTGHRLSRRAALGLPVALLEGCRRRKFGAVPGFAFVANEEGRSIAVVGLDPFALLRHIRLDAAPAALIAHPSKPLIYALTPASGTVHEIDTADLSVSRRVQMQAPATAMRLDISGEQLWVLSGPARRLSHIPAADLRVAQQVQLPAPAVDFDLTSEPGRSRQYWNDTNLAVLSYGTSGAVQVLDRRSGKLGPLIRIGGQTGLVRFRSDGKAVLAADLDGRMLVLVDAIGGKIITRLPLAVRPDNICFHPDGGQLFLTGEGRDAVVVVYPHNVAQVAETVLAGRAPGSMTASERYLFVTSPSTGDVIILNLETRRMVAVAAVGAEPAFIVLTPKNEYALVLNRKSGDMAVIRVAAIAPNRQKSAPLLTMVPVGSRPVSAVVTAA